MHGRFARAGRRDGSGSDFEREIWHAYEILQALDLLSLCICLVDLGQVSSGETQVMARTLFSIDQEPSRRVILRAPLDNAGRRVDLTVSVVARQRRRGRPVPLRCAGDRRRGARAGPRRQALRISGRGGGDVRLRPGGPSPVLRRRSAQLREVDLTVTGGTLVTPSGARRVGHRRRRRAASSRSPPTSACRRPGRSFDAAGQAPSPRSRRPRRATPASTRPSMTT